MKLSIDIVKIVQIFHTVGMILFFPLLFIFFLVFSKFNQFFSKSSFIFFFVLNNIKSLTSYQC